MVDRSEPRPPIVSEPIAEDVREDIASIGGAANSLLMTDILATPPRSRVFPNDRGETFCSGTICNPEPAWGEPGYSTSELSSLNPEATVRMGETRSGVNTGKISRHESYRDPQYPEDENFSVDDTVYGGWLSKTFFGIEQGQWRGRFTYGSVEGLETLIAFSAGTASGSNPVMGSAEWNGLVIAVDTTAPTQPVNGQAALIFDFASNTLDVK